MECPKCNSEKTNVMTMSYPKSYECEKCGYMFVKSPQALIDE